MLSSILSGADPLRAGRGELDPTIAGPRPSAGRVFEWTCGSRDWRGVVPQLRATPTTSFFLTAWLAYERSARAQPGDVSL